MTAKQNHNNNKNKLELHDKQATKSEKYRMSFKNFQIKK